MKKLLFLAITIVFFCGCFANTAESPIITDTSVTEDYEIVCGTETIFMRSDIADILPTDFPNELLYIFCHQVIMFDLAAYEGECCPDGTFYLILFDMNENRQYVLLGRRVEQPSDNVSTVWAVVETMLPGQPDNILWISNQAPKDFKRWVEHTAHNEISI